MIHVTVIRVGNVRGHLGALYFSRGNPLKPARETLNEWSEWALIKVYNEYTKSGADWKTNWILQKGDVIETEVLWTMCDIRVYQTEAMDGPSSTVQRSTAAEVQLRLWGEGEGESP